MKTIEKIMTAIVIISLTVFLYANMKFAAAAPSGGPVINVSINDNSFNPSSIVVGAPNNTSGEFVTIVWTNMGTAVHTVTSGNGTPDGLFDSGSLGPGANFTLEVNQTMYDSMRTMYPNGTLTYYCSFHFSLGMVGEITVSTTVIPEFPTPAFVLTVAILLPLLIVALRSKRTPRNMKG